MQFLPLQYQSGEVGINGDGEFTGHEQALDNHLTLLNIFYNNRAPGSNRAVGAVYPSFIDFYEKVVSATSSALKFLRRWRYARRHHRCRGNEDKIEMVQLTTWNDFAEGTIFEPTVERGQDLILQG